MGCCCQMPQVPQPIINAEAVFIYLCGFSLPEFEGITEEQKEIRYKNFEVSQTFTVNTQYSDDDSRRSTTYNGTKVVKFKAEGDHTDPSECDKFRNSYSESATRTISESSDPPEDSELQGTRYNSNTTWVTSGDRNGNGRGIRSFSESGSDQYGDSYSNSDSNSYIFSDPGDAGLSEAQRQGESTFVYRQEISLNDSGDGVTDTSSEILEKTWVYSKPLDFLDEIAKLEFPDPPRTIGLGFSENRNPLGSRLRFQVVVPNAHEGSYLKISWDYLDEPEGWDATIPDPDYAGTGDPPQIPKPDRPVRALKTGGTWTWSGPGNQSYPEGESWKSPWFEIPVPEFKGRRRIVNVRYSGYRETPYGTKPQAYSLDDVYEEE